MAISRLCIIHKVAHLVIGPMSSQALCEVNRIYPSSCLSDRTDKVPGPGGGKPTLPSKDTAVAIRIRKATRN